MKIGIIGDTHDQVQELKKALNVLKQENVEMILHTGDWVSAFTMEYYKDANIPIKGVWGNNHNDPRFRLMAHKLSLDLEITDQLELTVDGKKISVIHELDEIPEADVIIHGHDHKARVETKDGVLYINPGTLLHETFPWLKTDPSIAVYDSLTCEARVIKL